MGISVLADAQFGIAKVLHPYPSATTVQTTTTTAGVTVPVADGTTVAFTVASAAGITVGSGIVIGDGASWCSCTVTAVSGDDLTVVNNGAFVITSVVFGAGAVVSFNGSYQGLPGSCPIMFSESGIALDDLAGKPGYSPSLVRGLSVPMGARVMIWLPNYETIFGGNVNYKWGVSWRLRNTFDFRVARRAYHYPKAAPGIPDTYAPVGEQERVVLPAAWNSTLYSGSAPSPGYPSVTKVFSEFYQVNKLGSDFPPIVPTGVGGVMQQGVSDGEPSVTTTPTYQIVETQALGDELLIGLYKGDPTPANTWDFDILPIPGADVTLRLLSQYPDLGVYVMTGSAP